MAEKVELSGSVEKTLFKSAESGYTVFSLKVNSKESVTVTGHLPDVHDGTQVSLVGTWTFHPKFGRQFTAEECKVALPQSTVGIQRYLSSGLIKGIGPKFAEKLVDHFGLSTLDVIDKSPQRLHEVPGVGKKRVEQIMRAWVDQKEISKVMVFLQERDVSTAFAAKIYKKYGDQSIDIITKNPYRLVEDIWGVGFKSADQLALKLGFNRDSMFRVQAGHIQALTENVKNGHLYKLLSETCSATRELLELDDTKDQLIQEGLQELFDQGKVTALTDDKTDPDNPTHWVTLPQYYLSERNIARKLLSFKKKPRFAQFNIDKIYKLLRSESSFVDTYDDVGVHERGAQRAHDTSDTPTQQTPKKNSGISLNDDQQRGIISCLLNKVSIITGGPGTGKTTLVKKLLEVLDSQKVKIRMAAPTGRAAKRMFEGTGRPTETIHRLLEFNPQIMGFSRNEQNAIECDFLIIDEASMIDVFLMNSLLKALPDRAHLLLLGDIDQLPSVGAGDVLNDLISSDQVSVVRLTEIFRQAANSMIIVNAHNVNNGEFPSDHGGPGQKKDFFYIKQDNPEDIFGLLRRIYTKLQTKQKIKAENIVVLTPMNRGIVGTQRLNQELQDFLNGESPDKKTVSRFGNIYREGDRVMQIRNNYDKFVFNGDMGYITRIDPSDQELFIQFGERELLYNFAELNEIQLAYTISIHKSQGSEFDAVIIPVYMQHFMLLQKNLIYTAITRAKKMCILVGQSRAIAMAVKNQKTVERKTFLKLFLTTDLEAR